MCILKQVQPLHLLLIPVICEQIAKMAVQKQVIIFLQAHFTIGRISKT